MLLWFYQTKLVCLVPLLVLPVGDAHPALSATALEVSGPSPHPAPGQLHKELQGQVSLIPPRLWGRLYRSHIIVLCHSFSFIFTFLFLFFFFPYFFYLLSFEAGPTLAPGDIMFQALCSWRVRTCTPQWLCDRAAIRLLAEPVHTG